MIKLTAFENIRDNKTHRCYSYESWEKFRKMLEGMSIKPGYKPKKGEFKAGSPLITPAIYQPNTTRANSNVTFWGGWAALDIDEYEGSFEDNIKLFTDYSFICYSTASSTKEHPKFRMVFDLGEFVSTEKIRQLWYALNKEFNAMGDPQTKDLSRMYYVPAKYPNAYNFFFTNEGKSVNVESLIIKHKYVEPSSSFISKLSPEMQRKLIQHQRDTLTNTSIAWTSHNDCPFVSKKLLAEYRSIAHIDGTGRYYKIYGLMVNIASNAIRAKYPITPKQISTLIKQIDMENGNRYRHRPLEREATRALEFIMGKSMQ